MWKNINTNFLSILSSTSICYWVRRWSQGSHECDFRWFIKLIFVWENRGQCRHRILSLRALFLASVVAFLNAPMSDDPLQFTVCNLRFPCLIDYSCDFLRVLERVFIVVFGDTPGMFGKGHHTAGELLKGYIYIYITKERRFRVPVFFFQFNSPSD